MKQKLLLLIIAILIPIVAFAQKKEDHTGITVGVSLGLGQAMKYNWINAHLNECNHLGLIFTPNIGYRITKAWEVGAMARYEDIPNWTSFWGYGGYVEYSFLFLDSDRVRVFVDGRVTANRDKTLWIGGPQRYNFTEAGFTPGIAYRIPFSRVDLKLRYLFIGFNNSDKQGNYKDIRGCLDSGNWILDAGLRRLEIGASVTF